jgi:archaemetzincin
MKKWWAALLCVGAVAGGIYLWHSLGHPADFTELTDTGPNHWRHRAFTGRMCVVQFGDFPEAETELVKRQIVDYYGFSIDTTFRASLPDTAFYPPRQRYKALKLLHFLRDIKPAHCDKVIGLTNRDISIAKGTQADYGIMGYGFIGGPSCVASTFRLGQGRVPRAKFRERLVKVALHELGHTLGLPHCDHTPTCLMNDARGTIKQIDREEPALCPVCLGRLGFVKTIRRARLP